ncbi:TonB-dependent receptor [Colwellia sp. MB02u-18]|uniref:TonB-dependent receptor n=1 Tax=unclassified Colwellia TaxID=196834 RepID=UPI0015F6E55A|nr:MULTISPECIES: TonB-dependent receptor [unclassified Colwellia]MBA6222653.1 TonB-dependent receptor [Colwellia sp. MB3u-45]MBA6269159.1 TonB-dependent receptor [Colwellia sp. MB3u-43]MBA6322786.1 TonB-dependent receptor [Colwellia sp. MB02u-19]MBA6323441.1 TonB-dependent receptor [Colwellia sp. MB02u-18]MBA6332929.1 TonB-dependent receptor [Colwellia sp. MB02u-12]
MKLTNKNFKLNSLLTCMLISGAISGHSYAADENTEIAKTKAEQEVEVIEVTGGFRGALSRGLFEKRHATNSKETIMSEDVGKMPDLNLAESLQRVPGVAITREGGEGRNITVRGMGATYSQVTLNGMQIPASTGGLDSSGGVNRGRSFDFNMFGSDLFGQMDINKTYTASLEEGGVASTVSLHTLRPLDNPGFHATGSTQASYNAQNGDTNPRINGFISDTFLDDTFGVLVGISTSKRTVKQEGFGTVRWTGAHVKNENWADTSSTVITGTPNPSLNNPDFNASTDDPLDSMWVPRLPRTDSFNQDQSRNSFLVSLQARPIEDLEISFNMLDSKRDADVESYNFFAQMRNMFGSITPTAVTIDPTGRYIQAGTFAGVAPRSESRGQYAESDFNQIVIDADYQLSDTISINVMAGRATSEHHEEQYRYNLTGNTTTFKYDFTGNSDVPTMEYGYDITDVANFAWTGPHHRSDTVIRENETLRADIEWEFDDEGSVLRAGYTSNTRTIDSTHTRKPDGLVDANLASATNTNKFSSIVSDFGDTFGAPAGMFTDWLVADIDVVRKEVNSGKFSPDDRSGNYFVTEETSGLYVDADYFIGPVIINAGVRYVETTVKGGASDIEETYDNVLPALNITYNVTDDLLLRAAWSENVVRPNPQSLTGQVTGTPINGRVSLANPGVGPETITSVDFGAEWYFADESYVGITYFQKEITDAITSNTAAGVSLTTAIADIVADDPIYAVGGPSYDPSAVDPYKANAWDLTTQTNSTEVDEIKGFEIAARYITEIGIGVDANYTKIDSDDIVQGLSENAYNLGVFYENNTWGARLFLNARDDYQTGNAADGNVSQNNTGPTRIDFSSSYKVIENVTATLEIINLTNEKERNFTTGSTGDQDLVREFNSTGTVAVIGVRATF